MTDLQLQLALVRMLPEDLAHDAYGEGDAVRWITARTQYKPVIDTEWPYVCWLVEQLMTIQERKVFINNLRDEICKTDGTPHDFDWACIHAYWQQRALALCKVKGITP